MYMLVKQWCHCVWHESHINNEVQAASKSSEQFRASHLALSLNTELHTAACCPCCLKWSRTGPSIWSIWCSQDVLGQDAHKVGLYFKVCSGVNCPQNTASLIILWEAYLRMNVIWDWEHQITIRTEMTDASVYFRFFKNSNCKREDGEDRCRPVNSSGAVVPVSLEALNCSHTPPQLHCCSQGYVPLASSVSKINNQLSDQAVYRPLCASKHNFYCWSKSGLQRGFPHYSHGCTAWRGGSRAHSPGGLWCWVLEWRRCDRQSVLCGASLWRSPTADCGAQAQIAELGNQILPPVLHLSCSLYLLACKLQTSLSM